MVREVENQESLVFLWKQVKAVISRTETLLSEAQTLVPVV